MEENKKVIFSGIKPSGDLTLGNYIGALKNWVKLQDDYECFYSSVDLHAITVMQNPEDLRRRTLEVLAIFMAVGLNPEKSCLFIQSHVTAHAEAQWLLNCYTHMGELTRMTQFKDKYQKLEGQIGAGLLNYPILMAVDILLYNADLVPVGEDQKQHVEITRDLAQRFNNLYSPTFKIPEPYIEKNGRRVMDLQNPEVKMSKSEENPNGYILIMDKKDAIIKKVKRAVTDTLGIIKYREEQPGISNLIEIYSSLTGKTYAEIEKEYEGLGYGVFKENVGEAISSALMPIQEKINMYLSDKSYIEGVYKRGAEKASYVANKTLNKMKRKIGLILKG